MCGINGILTPNASGYKENIQWMNQALSHRGPDDEGIWDNDDILLGHRRLSIIDLSMAGHQPMMSGDNRFVLVYNGELYNYLELKKELSQYPFFSNTDTEVVLAAWQAWGESCINRFNGMFAFAIWDNLEKTLFLVRDRLGIKPLYYTKSLKQIIFSSEIRSLLASGLVNRKLNIQNLTEYLRYQTVHAPNTILENVNLLEPGHYLKVTKNKSEKIKYWSLDYKNINSTKSYNEAKEKVKCLLENSVKKRLVSDVPFGAFLSGGIDSSAITALMTGVSNRTVNTFSVSFDEKAYSEARYAEIIAKKYDTKHTNIHLTPTDFLNYLPDAMQAMDHPSGDGPNTWVVSKVTKESGITMALSGLGGDELFCGYDIFTKALKLNKFRIAAKIPVPLRKMIGSSFQLTGKSVAKQKIKDILSLSNWNLQSFYPLYRQVLHDHQISQIINNHTMINLQSKALNSHLDGSAFNNKNSLLSQTSLLEISTYMQNVLLRDTDQMSMASALEVRVPFLDHKLIEFVMSLPDHIKYPHTPKKLLVDVMGDLLPAEIVNRPKMGFLLPWQNWMKKELKSFCADNLKHLNKIGQIDDKGLNKLWQSFLKDDPMVTWSRIWPLVVLGFWMDKHNIQE